MGFMPKLPTITDKPCQDLLNRVYEAAASWDGTPYTVSTTCSSGKRRYLGMSGIGHPCERSLWYGFRSFTPAPLDGRVKMIFELGDHVEQIQIHWLQAAGFEITNKQDSYHDHNGYFRGHPDGIIHGVTNKPHAWDAKSINKKGFDSLKKIGMQKSKPIYYAQAQMMMHYSGCDRAIYTFQCKDNSEWYAERFYYNQELAQSLIEKAHRIISSNYAPDRAFDEDNFQCDWCNYKLQCYYPKENILSEQVCGNCYYMGFKKNTCQAHCKHPSHTVRIKTWGIKCDDWLYMYFKETPGKEKYPQKATI